MTNPFLSLAVLDTNDAKHRPYCAQIRSQGSHGVSAPSPFPSPVAGEGPSIQIAACSPHRLGSVTFCATITRPIGGLAALRCPEKSSRCSLARFFRPLRMLRLAASATGGAQLRIPIHRDTLTLQICIINPSRTSPVKSFIYAIFILYFPIL